MELNLNKLLFSLGLLCTSTSALAGVQINELSMRDVSQSYGVEVTQTLNSIDRFDKIVHLKWDDTQQSSISLINGAKYSTTASFYSNNEDVKRIHAESDEFNVSLSSFEGVTRGILSLDGATYETMSVSSAPIAILRNTTAEELEMSLEDDQVFSSSEHTHSHEHSMIGTHNHSHKQKNADLIDKSSEVYTANAVAPPASPAVIRVGYAYAIHAKAGLLAQGENLNNLAAMNVAVMNQYLKDSDLDRWMIFEYAGYVEWDFDDWNPIPGGRNAGNPRSSFGTAAWQASVRRGASRQGNLAVERHQMRADIVGLVIDDYYNTKCGQATLNAEGWEAFFEVEMRCIKSPGVSAHEIGHLMGLAHDSGSSGSSPLHSFGRGYVTNSGTTELRTLMATNCTSNACRVLRVFSNPDQNFSGYNVLSGNAFNADSARALRLEAPRFAAYMN